MLLAWVLAMGPSVLLVAAAAGVAELAGVAWRSRPDTDPSLSWFDWTGAVLLAPLAETWLLGVMLWPIRVVARKPFHAALIAALVWGALHGLLAWIRFFGSAWSFFVFSCAYLAWRRRSYRHAFIAAAVPHALLNATVMIFVALAD